MNIGIAHGTLDDDEQPGAGKLEVANAVERHLARVAIVVGGEFEQARTNLSDFVRRKALEAAEMDGASAFQRFWHITLPLLGPMIRLSIFFSVIGALQLFDVIVPLTGGGPFDTTNTMVSFLYYFGITRMRVGFGSAVGVVLFCICVTFAFGYRRLFMRDD